MKTVSAKKEEVARRWYVVDAKDQVLGRLATRIASVLRGKHKPIYTPHIDTGDFVIVINADKVKLTGKKEDEKMYYDHTGWAGGIVERNASKLREREPTAMVERAVGGMIPRGNLGRAVLSKLRVYASAEHPHAAQKPEPLPQL
jgi:large subunit ribosomal protein L13